MTTTDEVALDQLELTIHPDGVVTMRTLALGIPGAIGVLVELEAKEEALVPSFVIKVEAGGLPGIADDDEAVEFIADLLELTSRTLRESKGVES